MKRGTSPAALDLVEDAVRLLRSQPVTTWVCHLAGTLPFVVVAWFFWSDMSRGVGAQGRCATSSLGLALAFGWMKCWHLEFARRLRASISGRPRVPWSGGDWVRMHGIQCLVQPWQLVLLPVASLLVVPFGWVLAFFENVTILGAEPGARCRSVCRRAWVQAMLWPAQNHTLLAVLSLLGLVVTLNLVATLGWVPSLLKSFFGVETAFTRSPWAMLNTTFLAVCAGLAFALLDPLVKAVYVLRCFHGESVRTGEDLRAALRRLPPWVPVLWLGLWLGAVDLSAAEPPASPRSAEALDQAIVEVMRHPVYEWRFPRETASDSSGRERGFVGAMMDKALDWVRDTAKTMGRWLERSAKWLGELLDDIGRKVFGRGWRPPVPGGAMDFAGALQLLIWLVLAGSLAAVCVLAVRGWRRQGTAAGAAPVSVARPDLRSEEVTATQLPEDEWLRMAEELFAAGDGRLGLRALYLAALSGLARRGWIRVARHKTNRDYEQEVARHAREQPRALGAFADGVRLFESCWYGRHEVTDGMVGRFRADLKELQACENGTSGGY